MGGWSLSDTSFRLFKKLGLKAEVKYSCMRTSFETPFKYMTYKL